MTKIATIIHDGNLDRMRKRHSELLAVADHLRSEAQWDELAASWRSVTRPKGRDRRNRGSRTIATLGRGRDASSIGSLLPRLHTTPHRWKAAQGAMPLRVSDRAGFRSEQRDRLTAS